MSREFDDWVPRKSLFNIDVNLPFDPDHIGAECFSTSCSTPDEFQNQLNSQVDPFFEYSVGQSNLKRPVGFSSSVSPALLRWGLFHRTEIPSFTPYELRNGRRAARRCVCCSASRLFCLIRIVRATLLVDACVASCFAVRAPGALPCIALDTFSLLRC